jgi:recombinational DNA repair protein RecR
MCGTHHPVGTRTCSTCRASGVTQLRLMFECPSCGRLDLAPVCEVCPAASASDEDLILAEEVTDEPLSLGDTDGVRLPYEVVEDEADEMAVVDLTEDEYEVVPDEDLGDWGDSELDEDD